MRAYYLPVAKVPSSHFARSAEPCNSEVTDNESLTRRSACFIFVGALAAHGSSRPRVRLEFCRRRGYILVR